MSNMKIVVANEQTADEKRVALTPEVVKKLVDQGYAVCVEKGAGQGASFTDEAFEKAGAQMVKQTKDLYKDAHLVIRVSQPQDKDLDQIPEKAFLVGLLKPFEFKNCLPKTVDRKITSMALELVPRISRAQAMDVLSSQSNLAGYRAVIEAAAEYTRSMPLMMTAAGTIAPAKVLILGAGVAGLQAIATARRLGAVVSAFDVRPAVKEQVESLGATFVEVESSESGDGTGGYAKEMSDDYKKRQAEKLAEVISQQDIVITTALIPGKPAPLLVTKEMVSSMKPGSIIVDLAAESGGNCAYTEKGKIVRQGEVTVMGQLNMPSRIATDSSQVYARNVLNFLKVMVQDGQIKWDDEIIQATLLTKEGQVVSPIYQTTPAQQEAPKPVKRKAGIKES